MSAPNWRHIGSSEWSNAFALSDEVTTMPRTIKLALWLIIGAIALHPRIAFNIVKDTAFDSCFWLNSVEFQECLDERFLGASPDAIARFLEGKKFEAWGFERDENTIGFWRVYHRSLAPRAAVTVEIVVGPDDEISEVLVNEPMLLEHSIVPVVTVEF